MTHVKISNSGGTLYCDALSFNERLSCDSAIRDIPLGSSGQYIDVDTYRFSEPVTVKVKVRLTNDQKNTLEDIFYANSKCTLTVNLDTGETTIYKGWLQNIQTIYRYRKESENVTEWIWLMDLDFAIGTTSGESEGEFMSHVQDYCEDYLTFTQSQYFQATSVSSCTLDHVQTKNNQERYIYKDYGTNYFTDFIHTIKFHWNSISSGGDYSRCIFWMLSNDVGGWNELKTAHKTAVALMFSYPSGTYRISLMETYNGQEYSSNLNNLPYSDATYYPVIQKEGNILTVKVYSDAARTNLLASTSLTLHGNWSFRYLTSSSSYISGTVTSGTFTISKLDLNYKGVECDCVSSEIVTEDRFLTGAKVDTGKADTWTVNGLTGFKLIVNPPNAGWEANETVSGDLPVFWGAGVFIRTVVGGEDEVTSGSPVAIVMRTETDGGIQTAEWQCPTIEMEETDALVIRHYIKFGTGDWICLGLHGMGCNGCCNGITEQLGAKQLRSNYWTLSYYTLRHYHTYNNTTTGYLYWGGMSYQTGIKNLKYVRNIT